jgi:hypothetical protein
MQSVEADAAQEVDLSTVHAGQRIGSVHAVIWSSGRANRVTLA